MGGFCLLVELHREGSALQPAQQACFYLSSSFLTKGWSWSVEGLLSRGLPHLVSIQKIFLTLQIKILLLIPLIPPQTDPTWSVSRSSRGSEEKMEEAEGCDIAVALNRCQAVRVTLLSEGQVILGLLWYT